MLFAVSIINGRSARGQRWKQKTAEDSGRREDDIL
jgi:hypothetical protein